MRTYDISRSGKSSNAKPAIDENDESHWVIDYMALCDAIYVCDWIKE
jgi:hypothetical protein